MNTGTFRSSIDWSHELVNSTVWVLVAFAITAPCLIVVLVVIGRTTEWGRQFWRVTGPTSQAGRAGGVGHVGAAAVIDDHRGPHHRLISYYTNDVFTVAAGRPAGNRIGEGVTDSGIHGFWVTIGIFLILAVCTSSSTWRTCT